MTIYSGASILGGQTIIGKGSVIGSNAFITKSVPAGTRVTIKNQELVLKDRNGMIIEKNDLDQSEAWFYVKWLQDRTKTSIILSNIYIRAIRKGK